MSKYSTIKAHMQSTKNIQLTRGKFAIVDSEDFEFLNQWKWYCNNSGYAVRDIVSGKKKKYVFIHRILNNTPEGFITDHINRNSLDNRKINLRTSDKSKNAINSKVRVDNTSGVKGISWSERRKKWRAYITLNHKTTFLGEFSKMEDAILNRKQAELIYH